MKHHKDYASVRAAIKREFPRFAPGVYGSRFFFVSVTALLCCELFLSYSVAVGGVLQVFAVLLLALSLLRFQFILHEACHGVLVRSRKMNDLYGRVAGCIVGYQFENYRINHSLHHRHVGTNKDTEIDNFIDSRRGTMSARKQMIFKLLKSLFFVDSVMLLYSLNSRTETGNRENYFKPLVVVSGGIQLVFLSSFLPWHKIGEVIVLYLVAVMSLVFFFNRLRGISEHELDEALQRYDYSKTHLSNVVVNQLISPLNFNYHFEHHVFPEISSYYYPQISRLMVKRLPQENWLVDGYGSTLYGYWRK